MKHSTRNQIAVAENKFQGNTKKVLCVCSAGVLRSPTMATILTQKYGFNTRACGASQDYALVPITQALAIWADEILCVSEVRHMIEPNLNYYDIQAPVIDIDLIDNYEYMQPELVAILEDLFEDMYGKPTEGKDLLKVDSKKVIETMD